MEKIVKLEAKDFLNKTELKIEEDVKEYCELMLNFIKDVSEDFKKYNIPITISLQFQDSHPKAEVFRKFFLE